MTPAFWQGFICGLTALPVLAALIYVIRNIDKNPEAW